METIPGNTGLLWDPAALLPRPDFLGSVYIFRRQDKNMWNKKKRVIKRYIKNYRENERKYLHKSICNCTA